MIWLYAWFLLVACSTVQFLTVSSFTTCWLYWMFTVWSEFSYGNRITEPFPHKQSKCKAIINTCLWFNNSNMDMKPSGTWRSNKQITVLTQRWMNSFHACMKTISQSGLLDHIFSYVFVYHIIRILNKHLKCTTTWQINLYTQSVCVCLNLRDAMDKAMRMMLESGERAWWRKIGRGHPLGVSEYITTRESSALRA